MMLFMSLPSLGLPDRFPLVIDTIPCRPRRRPHVLPVGIESGLGEEVVGLQVGFGFVEAAPVVTHTAFPAGAKGRSVVLVRSALHVVRFADVGFFPVLLFGSRADGFGRALARQSACNRAYCSAHYGAGGPP